MTDASPNKEIVTSDVLEYFPSNNADVLGDLYGNIINQYKVEVTFESPTGRPPGGLPIRLTGKRRNVEACIRDVWVDPSIEVGTYEASDRNLLVMSYMGDKVAEHRLSTGCRIGCFDHPRTYGELLDRDTDEGNPLRWDRHWADADEKCGGDSASRDEFAIELLANAGVAPLDYVPDDGYDSCVTAQSYLNLAFAHSPSLMVYLERIIDENASKSKPTAQGVAQYSEAMFRECVVSNDLVTAAKWLRMWEAADKF